MPNRGPVPSQHHFARSDSIHVKHRTRGGLSMLQGNIFSPLTVPIQTPRQQLTSVTLKGTISHEKAASIQALLSMTKHIAAVLLLPVLIPAVRAQTLFTVSAVNPSVTHIIKGTTVISAVGVGSDGWTTYTEAGTVSLDFFAGPSTTTTLIDASRVAEVGGEFEANASGFRFSILGGQLAETCAFGGDGRGTCVEREVVASSTRLAITLSGSVVPFYTLAAAGASVTAPPSSPTVSGPSSPSTSTSAPPNSASASVSPIAAIVLCCIVGTLLQVL
ncbi:hypothetical protein DFH08DRAFT_908480 [Mycena albidolilacea]|uniref:Uncharacterized protein n=1 Tax=Mycena albidolilacea TaxID=1033008 RepID=A0AAD6YWT3_9AGAR|nr:hypothetical protein DFH08DRAFT_908480 [Mycena albidolilacea]